MKEATATNTVEIEALRVGMFVQLDGGWMSHPFPLSNFRIASVEQITTLRSLGIERVRWSPQQSDPGLVALVRDLAPTSEEPTSRVGSSRAVEPPSFESGPVHRPPREDAPPVDDEPATEPGVYPVAEPTGEPVSSADIALVQDPPQARQLRRQQLAAQQAALQLCERQFAEAARDCRQLTDLVMKRPQEAREQAEALTRALAAKMLVDKSLCIRLLTDAAGDKASVHALNVTVVSMLMGRSLGLAQADLLDLGTGAMLHDIGKLELPDRVRYRDERSTAAETRLYEEHVAFGTGLARKMGLSAGATLVIAQHHEQADGSGFPLRLRSDRMTTAARIVSLVNRYDNLCNPEQAARALTPHESLSLLFAQGADQFDIAILSGFIKMMGVYPAGSAVQLTDDRFAIVVGVDSLRPLKPRVQVYDAKVPGEEALILDLGAAPNLGIRRSIKPQHLPVEVLEYLSPRSRVAYFFEPIDEAPLAA